MNCLKGEGPTSDDRRSFTVMPLCRAKVSHLAQFPEANGRSSSGSSCRFA